MRTRVVLRVLRGLVVNELDEDARADAHELDRAARRRRVLGDLEEADGLVRLHLRHACTRMSRHT
jgi:hypothetical protein